MKRRSDWGKAVKIKIGEVREKDLKLQNQVEMHNKEEFIDNKPEGLSQK